MNNRHIFKLTLSGLLIAIGIIIPMFSPIKVILEPASYTLASHVPIFIAMLLSPGMAVAVAIGTTLGFLFGGFPLVVVIRAASHVIFALLGALYVKKNPSIVSSALKLRVFSLIIALLHSVAEAAVAAVFYFTGSISTAYYQKGFAFSILLLVGLGTVIHSMVDFEIANIIMLALRLRKKES